VRRTGDTAQKLSGEILNVMARKRGKFIFLEEIVNTHPKKLGHEAYVVSVIKPVQEVYAFTGIKKKKKKR
jgi:hypothetical protein